MKIKMNHGEHLTVDHGEDSFILNSKGRTGGFDIWLVKEGGSLRSLVFASDNRHRGSMTAGRWAELFAYYGEEYRTHLRGGRDPGVLGDREAETFTTYVELRAAPDGVEGIAIAARIRVEINGHVFWARKDIRDRDVEVDDPKISFIEMKDAINADIFNAFHAPLGAETIRVLRLLTEDEDGSGMIFTNGHNPDRASEEDEAQILVYRGLASENDTYGGDGIHVRITEEGRAYLRELGE